MGKAQASSGARQLVDELGGEQRMVLLLDFRLKCGFDSLERYVVGNMLGDLLPDGTLLMTTGVDRDVLVLADAMAESSVETAVQVPTRKRMPSTRCSTSECDDTSMTACVQPASTIRRRSFCS